MKIHSKQFDIFADERPKILFLGNGLCRAYGGQDWNKVLDEIKDKEKFPKEAKNYDVPMPLKAAMLTNGNLASRMRDQKKDNFSSFVASSSKQRSAIKQFADLGFDCILTTNYSYEIESALLGKEQLTEKDITKLLSFSGVDHAQTQYFINTFNKIDDYQVWHIHGEARKPNSMIIGQYYYGNILFRYKNYFDQRDDQYKKAIKNRTPIEMNSWLDAFVFGDVYILGFGFDFSETDLWWLLEKKKLTDNHGKTFFFSPITAKPKNLEKGHISADDCKNHLFDVYDVKHESFGLKANCNDDYRAFYNKVYKYLKNTF